METVIYYVFLNVLLFGSLYLVGKIAESAVWYLIENYDSFHY